MTEALVRSRADAQSIALGTVVSTSDEARKRLDRIVRPTWITATRQTAGRGRRGRRWVSPAGSFFATLVLPGTGRERGAALMSFVAALAVRDALSELAGRGDPFRLKWPNDVLAGDGKISGILLETAGSFLLVGIGVNLVGLPAEADCAADKKDPAETGAALPPADFASLTGMTVGPDRFLEALAPAFEAWEGRLRRNGFATVRSEWLKHAVGRGLRVRASTGERDIFGIFETLDADGALVLATADGRRRILAADIHFGQAVPADASCD